MEEKFHLTAQSTRLHLKFENRAINYLVNLSNLDSHMYY